MNYWRWLPVLVFAAILFVAFLYWARASTNTSRSVNELREERLRLEQVEPHRVPLSDPPPFGLSFT